MFCFFFFQAEDGIRDYKVTGVQTCALPILHRAAGRAYHHLQRAGEQPRRVVFADAGADRLGDRGDWKDEIRAAEDGRRGPSRTVLYRLLPSSTVSLQFAQKSPCCWSAPARSSPRD